MKHHLSVVVPYRNRENHLKKFIPHMTQFLGDLPHTLLIVEQADEKLFNRAKLLNVGFDYGKKESDYFAFHDIDMLPLEADYSYPDKPYHMATNVGQFGGGVAYKNYYGGVNLFNEKDFKKINGYSNNFWGWGGEDDDILKRIKKHGYGIYRRKGVYKSLYHPINGPTHKNYQNNVNLLYSKYDFNKEGLNTLQYELISTENKSYTHIKVKL